MKKNLFGVLIGISIFVSSYAVRLFPLSNTIFLVDNDEYLPIKPMQEKIGFYYRFIEKHFKWKNHPFSLFIFDQPIETSLILYINKLPQDIMYTIYSLNDPTKHISKYFEELETERKICEAEEKLEKITDKLNEMITTNNQLKELVVMLKQNKTLDKLFDSCIDVESLADTCDNTIKSKQVTFSLPNRTEVFTSTKKYIKYLNQLITQREKLMQMEN